MTTRTDLVEDLGFYLDFIAAVMSIAEPWSPSQVFIDCWAQSREIGKIDDPVRYGPRVVDAYGEIIENCHISDEVDVMDAPLELVRICRILDALSLAIKEN